MRIPALWLRECIDVQVTIKSPTPARPAKVSFLPPMATPKRAVSVSPASLAMRGYCRHTPNRHTHRNTKQSHFSAPPPVPPHNIRAGINTKAFIHESILHHFCRFSIQRCGPQPVGTCRPYLLGVGRTRQGDNTAVSLCFFVYDLAQPQRRPFFNTFGYRNNQRTVPQIRRGF